MTKRTDKLIRWGVTPLAIVIAAYETFFGDDEVATEKKEEKRPPLKVVTNHKKPRGPFPLPSKEISRTNRILKSRKNQGMAQMSKQGSEVFTDEDIMPGIETEFEFKGQNASGGLKNR